MKMDDALYKKYTIKTIISPGAFYAVEYGKDIQNGAKQTLSPGDVKKFSHVEEISVGLIVAVKYENELYRGWITDIYNRCFKPTYYAWLVDNGNNIETSFDSIFMIQSSELKNIKLNASKVIVHGIQPVTIELLVSSVNLDCSRNNLEGILRKRESSEWSPAAFKFVKDLFRTNKYIYVKCIDINGSTVTGDIYYKHKTEDVLISLAQTLCDNDFAVFSTNHLGITESDYQGNNYLNSIERRIPNIPKDVGWEEFSDIHQDPVERGNRSSSGNLSSCSASEKSSNSGLDKFLKNSRAKATSSFSPSWILKKMIGFTPSTSSESFKSSCQQIDQAGSTVSSPKVSIFRIVERNIQLFNDHKAN